MWTYAIVKGSTEESFGIWGDSTKKDYICYVCYSSIRANEILIKEYFLNYFHFNSDILDLIELPPLDDYNCLCAIITYYFRNKGLKFKYDSHEFCLNDQFPDRKPDKRADNYKIWIDVLNKGKITSPKSAAYMLYRAVENGKISVESAKNLVSHRYPDHLHAWSKIMSEFRKYGGVYTKKYLRKP